MKGDEDMLVIGLLVVGAATLGRKSVPWGPPTSWVWPVPDATINGVIYPAVISDGWGTDRPDGKIHRGVDVMYRRRTPRDLSEYPNRTPEGTQMHVAPPHAPILAARDGVIWSVAKTPRGWTIVISHGKPFATYYTHLESAAFPVHKDGVSVATGKPTKVRAGDYLGPMGWDPLDKSRTRHLHFAVWVGGAEESAVDPESAIVKWSRVPWRWNPKS